jgi:hypothetical protein
MIVHKSQSGKLLRRAFSVSHMAVFMDRDPGKQWGTELSFANPILRDFPFDIH